MWGCSNFVEKTFRDGGLCQYAEPISELYFGGLGEADHHTIVPCLVKHGNVRLIE